MPDYRFEGMARMLSQQLTGKLLEGVWHTAVVVYGKEVYYGQGIQVDDPGTTMHGQPVDIVDMGDTSIPEDVFWEYIEAIRETWTAEKYHLFDNNCNNFSKEVCQFLVAKDIPSYIIDLPKEFLSTPFGQQIAPIITEMFGPSRIAAEHQPDLDFSKLLDSNPGLAAAVTGAMMGGAPTDFSAASASSTPQPAAQQQQPQQTFVGTPTIMSTPRAPILFSQCSQLEKIFGKLEEFLKAHSIAYDATVLGGIMTGLKDKFELKKPGALKLPASWNTMFNLIIQSLPENDLFPALDIFRLLILDNTVSTTYIQDKTTFLPRLLYRLVHGPTKFSELSKATRLMLLRLACNLFSTDPSLAHYLSSKAVDRDHPATVDASAASLATVSHRSILTALLVESLLSEDATVRQGASSLAFNMAARALVMRAIAGDDPLLEEWEAELVAAIVKSVEPEDDHEILLRLLSALGLLLFERSESLVSLAQVLDLQPLLASKQAKVSNDGLDANGSLRAQKILDLAKEITAIIS
ncbi:hypothetical protein HDU97_007982 [Phlyctochytrium planicorne]|nr:hypothetical protein HDU97_007982 [Phlyctochytrium planicorne]